MMTEQPESDRAEQSEPNTTPASRPPDMTPDPAVLALGRTVERTQRQFRELTQDVNDLAAMVAEMADTLAGASPEEPDEADGDADTPAVAPVPGVRAWLLATDVGLAQSDLAELSAWLDRVYLRFPDASLSSCWMWHPAVVEELWWLRCSHVEAYHSKKGSWMRAGDWHDRLRPGVVRRVGADIGSCELALHVAGQRRALDAAQTPLAEHAALVAQAWANPDGPSLPAPTQAQLDESDWLARSQSRAYSRAHGR